MPKWIGGNLTNDVEELNDEFRTVITYKLFEEGKQFPPANHIERISKQKRMKTIYDGKLAEIYERASKLLRDGSPEQAEQLEKLYIGVNLADILVTKPADLLVGETPIYETGHNDESAEQQALNKYVEQNDLNTVIHESATGNGIRGDSWVKVRYGYRQDYSELMNVLSTEEFNAFIEGVDMEPIIEHVTATDVFPETSQGNAKGFKAVNIAYVEYVVNWRGEENPYLNVERHLPGFIVYERFRLYENYLEYQYGYPLQVFTIGKQVPTGRAEDVIETGVSDILVRHIPYKSEDTTWEGVGGLEKIETVLTAINDRMVQIDYVLWKMMDPTAYGPSLEDGAGNNTTKIAGGYIPVGPDEQEPGYMTWDARLDQAFKQLDELIGLAFMKSETPQWLFGTTMAGAESGGSGTSHTDGAAIKQRFMPILSKVKRIRRYYDRGIRDALWLAQQLDVIHGDANFTPVYPKIHWKDGVPANELEQAEIMQIRTGDKPTIDQHTAIKRQDEVDDGQAKETLARIEGDDERESGPAVSDPEMFRQPGGGADGSEDE
ncbi:phage portal protein [Salibacterium salarium]|uniref:Phage portal protein n=1 Tax=Salibacterium salarium TaxID=284579 RepID=A0A428MSH1_9BACI|nr:phage portal protein [Salibacterium salarium]RSL29120.1 phage portal protein [Salibacterium salarium]